MAFCSISVLAGAIPWNDGEKGGTLSFGSDASGDNTLQLPQEDYETQVKELDFFAGAGGTLTVDGGTSGWSFGMPTNNEEFAWTDYPFAIKGAAGPLFAVWRQSIYQAPKSTSTPMIELTNAQFRVTRDGTKSELHLDGGVWNTYDPYGAPGWTHTLIGSGYGDAQLENRVYVHEGAELDLGYASFSGAARDYNLFQIDGGKHRVRRNFVLVGDDGHYPDVAKTLEMRVTGADTKLDIDGRLYFDCAVNGGPGMGVPSNHTNDTVVLKITDGATVNVKGNEFWTHGNKIKEAVVDVSNGGAFRFSGIAYLAYQSACPMLITGNGGYFQTSHMYLGSKIKCRVAMTNSVFTTGVGELRTYNQTELDFVNCSVTNSNYYCSSAVNRMKGGNWCITSTSGFQLANANDATASAWFDDADVWSYGPLSVAHNTGSTSDVMFTNNATLYVKTRIKVGTGANATGTLTARDGANLCAWYYPVEVGVAAGSTGLLDIGAATLRHESGAESATMSYIGESGNGTLLVHDGGSFSNHISYVKVAVNAGSSGTVKLTDGGILSAEYLIGGNGTSTLEADGGIIHQSVNTTKAFISALTAAKVGAEGLTVDSKNAVTISQKFENLDNAEGLVILTGAGAKTLTGASTHAVTRIAESSATIASCDAVVEVCGGATLSSANGSAGQVTYGGLVIGEGSTGGIFAVDANDTVTTVSAPTFNKVYISLNGTPANGTYPLVKTAAPVDAAAKAGWAGAYLYAGRQDGKMYAFTVTEAEGVTSFNVVIDDARALDPSLVKKYNGAGGVVTVDDVEAVDAVEFDSYSSYSVGGDGLFAFNDSGAGYVKSLLGSHLLGIGLFLPGTTEFYVEEGAELEVSGSIQNGAVRKTGLGKLTLSGDGNSFQDDITVAGGTLRLESAGAGGFCEAALSNGIILKRGTLEFESEEDDPVLRRNLVVDAGVKTAVVVNARSPLTITDMTVTSGDFIKRGPGTLAIDFTKNGKVAVDNGYQLYNATGDYFDFPANGDGPSTKSFDGMNVTEGVFELRGGDGVTVSCQKYSRVGMNTADGTADPVFFLNGTRYEDTGGQFQLGLVGADTFAESFTYKSVNSGHSIDGFLIGSVVRADGTPCKYVLDFDNSWLGVSWSLGLGQSEKSPLELNLRNGSKLSPGSLNFNRPFHFRLYDGLLSRASGRLVGDNSIDITLGYYGVGTFDLRNADFRVDALKRGSCPNYAAVFSTNSIAFCFDNAVWYPKAKNVDLALYEAETVTFEAKAGGMIVSNDVGTTFRTACPFTGEGCVVKAGAGTLEFGRAFTIKGTDKLDQRVICDTNYLDRTYTMDASGGLEVREGVVIVSNGTIRTDADVEVGANGVLDLSNSEVTLGSIGGEGTVRNGALSKMQLAMGGEDEFQPSSLAFENCAFAGKTKVVVTGAQPEFGKTYRIGTWDGTGASPDGASWRVTGCGPSVRMKVSVKDGVLYGTFNQVGFSVIVR